MLPTGHGKIIASRAMLPSGRLMNARLNELQKIVSSCPADPRGWFELGCAAQAVGEFPKAIECFIKVTQLAPLVAEGHFNLGNATYSLGRFDEALAAYEQAFELCPDRSSKNNIGNVWASMGNFDQAIAAYRTALDLPDDGTPLGSIVKNLGNALEADGRWDEADTIFQQALAKMSDSVSLALAYVRQLAKYDASRAMRWLDEQEAMVVGSPDLLAIRGYCATAQGEFTRAIRDFMQASSLEPEHPRVLAELGSHYATRGRHFESLACLHRALELTPDHRAQAPVSPALTSIQSAWIRSQLFQASRDWAQFKVEAERWDERYHELYPLQDNPATPGSALSPVLNAKAGLHIGLMIGKRELSDLAVFLQPLFKNAGESYSVTCFADVPRAQLKNWDARRNSAVNFQSTLHLNDSRLCQTIRNQGVQVLIDCIGHADQTRLGLFARRAAPLQIAWTGCFATTGLRNMDWNLGDCIAIEESHRSRFTEQVKHHPLGMFCCLSSISEMKATASDSETQLGISQVVGSACSPAEMMDSSYGLWARVLRHLPGTNLRLSHPHYADATLRQEVAERFGTREIEASRLEFMFGNEESFYQGLAVCLDPTPINSVASACKSLLRGVPVVCLLGADMPSRVTASLLTSADASAWVCRSPEEYCQRVSQLLQERPSRQDLRIQVAQSQLCNDREWCEQLVTLLKEEVGKRN